MDKGGAAQLCAVACEQDRKIAAYLRSRGNVHFWYAGYPTQADSSEELLRLHDLGFDNYPHADVPFDGGLFFFEEVLGCKLRVVDEHCGSTFHTWCEPAIERPSDIYGLKPDLAGSEVWCRYLDAVARYRDEAADEALPICFTGFSLLDCACGVCGSEALFTYLYEAPQEVGHLLDMICDLYLASRRQVEALGARLVNYYGFPGVYCNDLQMINLSPAMIEEFLLPRYARVAQECGGMILSLNCPDVGLMGKVLSVDPILGCAFHKQLPLDEIDRAIGDKLFVIHSYVVRDDLDAPAVRDGVWCNPIVSTYSAELPEVYGRLGSRCGMIISVERMELSDACRLREDPHVAEIHIGSGHPCPEL